MAKVGGWELDLSTGKVHMTKQTQILHEIDESYVPPVYSTVMNGIRLKCGLRSKQQWKMQS